jgi:hypothetical protein
VLVEMYLFSFWEKYVRVGHLVSLLFIVYGYWRGFFVWFTWFVCGTVKGFSCRSLDCLTIYYVVGIVR